MIMPFSVSFPSLYVPFLLSLPLSLSTIPSLSFSLHLFVSSFLRHSLPFLPARRYASAGNSDHNVSVHLSVRPSVRLSVTRRYCVKTKKASGMISSPSGSPKTLVF